MHTAPAGSATPPGGRGDRGPWARRLRDWGPTLLCLVLLLVARTSFANHYVVPSGSMQPALQPGDRVFVDMRAYGLRIPFTDIAVAGAATPDRGDVVVFRSPSDGTRLIKRVVAVAGDHVALRDGRLLVDGKPQVLGDGAERIGDLAVALDLADGGGPDIAGVVVPPGKLLVLGDHRGASADGRAFGWIDASAPYARGVGVWWRSGEGPTWKAL